MWVLLVEIKLGTEHDMNHLSKRIVKFRIGLVGTLLVTKTLQRSSVHYHFPISLIPGTLADPTPVIRVCLLLPKQALADQMLISQVQRSSMAVHISADQDAPQAIRRADTNGQTLNCTLNI